MTQGSNYNQMVTAGASLVAGMLQARGSSRAAYNQAYAEAAQRAAIREAKHTSELNIAAIEQDRILSNVEIQIRQAQAEAAAIVSAAAAGVEGGSVDAVIYDTERNAAFAAGRVNAQAKQDAEYQSAAVASQQSSLLAIGDTQGGDYLASVLNVFTENDARLARDVFQHAKDDRAQWSK